MKVENGQITATPTVFKLFREKSTNGASYRMELDNASYLKIKKIDYAGMLAADKNIDGWSISWAEQ